MVDTQPYTGRRHSEAAMPQVVIDHHETGGVLEGVLFSDIRTHLGATSTMVTGYLIEQKRGRDAPVSHRPALRDRFGNDGLSARGQLAR